MEHDPALEAHEQAEHAAHAAHEQDPFVARVAMTVAVLAVMAATAGSLETVEAGRAIALSSAAVLAQEQATDAWNEYQADSLKRHMYEIAAAGGGAKADEWRGDIPPERVNQARARGQAEKAEHARDTDMADSTRHEERHHWLTGSATLIEIGIALSTVAIITKRRSFWLAAMALGAAGAVLFAIAYMTA